MGIKRVKRLKACNDNEISKISSLERHQKLKHSYGLGFID
jgi:hypothetical protein